MANEACCRAAGEGQSNTDQPCQDQVCRGHCQLTAIDLRQPGPGAEGNKTSVSLRIGKHSVPTDSLDFCVAFVQLGRFHHVLMRLP